MPNTQEPTREQAIELKTYLEAAFADFKRGDYDRATLTIAHAKNLISLAKHRPTSPDEVYSALVNLGVAPAKASAVVGSLAPGSFEERLRQGINMSR